MDKGSGSSHTVDAQAVVTLERLQQLPQRSIELQRIGSNRRKSGYLFEPVAQPCYVLAAISGAQRHAAMRRHLPQQTILTKPELAQCIERNMQRLAGDLYGALGTFDFLQQHRDTTPL